MTTINYSEYFENNTLRLEVSHRGGGIEIDATEYLSNSRTEYPLQMTAYQNYLGGGMTGSVQGSIEGRLREYPKTIQAKALKLNEALKYYFWTLSNDEVAEWDEWAASPSFEAQQLRAGSAY
jgi:hypothetical protein